MRVPAALGPPRAKGRQGYNLMRTVGSSSNVTTREFCHDHCYNLAVKVSDDDNDACVCRSVCVAVCLILNLDAALMVLPTDDLLHDRTEFY